MERNIQARKPRWITISRVLKILPLISLRVTSWKRVLATTIMGAADMPKNMDRIAVIQKFLKSRVA